MSPLSRFPGPRTWAVSRIPYLQEKQNGNLVHRIKELHETFGEAVRIAPNEVSFISSNAWQDIYGHHPGRGTLPKWGYGDSPNGIESIFTAKDAEHSRFRRLMARGFSDKALRDMEPILQKPINALISSFRERISHSGTESTVVDMVDWYDFTGHDIISELTFGESFDCIGSERVHPWNAMLYKNLRELSWLASFEFFKVPGVERILRLGLPRSVIRKVQAHFNMTRELLPRRLETRAKAEVSPQHQDDFVAHMLRNGDDANNKGMSLLELEVNVNFLLLAGMEIISTALLLLYFFCCKVPAK